MCLLYACWDYPFIFLWLFSIFFSFLFGFQWFDYHWAWIFWLAQLLWSVNSYLQFWEVFSNYFFWVFCIYFSSSLDLQWYKCYFWYFPTCLKALFIFFWLFLSLLQMRSFLSSNLLTFISVISILLLILSSEFFISDIVFSILTFLFSSFFIVHIHFCQ